MHHWNTLCLPVPSAVPVYCGIDIYVLFIIIVYTEGTVFMKPAVHILVLQGYNLSMGTKILLSNTLHICLHIPQIKPEFLEYVSVYTMCVSKRVQMIFDQLFMTVCTICIPMYTNSSSDIVWSIFLAHIVCTCTQRNILQLVY